MKTAKGSILNVSIQDVTCRLTRYFSAYIYSIESFKKQGKSLTNTVCNTEKKLCTQDIFGASTETHLM